MAANETTLSYRWPQGSVVARMDVRQQTNGRAVAYIYADESEESRPVRQALREAIRQKGWGTLSDHRDGAYALRVSGLARADDILALLGNGPYVSGTPEQSSTVEEAVKTNGMWNYIRNHSLTISGALATIGNAMSIASGFHRGREIGQIGQGAAFAVADLPLAIAGERDDSRQFNNLLRQLKKHYEQNGIEIPKNAAIYAETNDSGKSLGTLAKDYLHRYANQIKCSMEVVAAGFTMHAGKAQNSSFKKYAPYFWGPGFLASLLIPERKIDEEKYAQAGTAERAWMRIQSNPLAIGGLLGYTNTIASYGSARNERKNWIADGKKGPPLYRWDVAIPSVMIGANGTYAMSKKTVGGDIKNDAMVRDVYIVAAQILNKQPETLREQAIANTVDFLAKRMEISDGRSEIDARLRTQMEVQRNSPWFEKRPLAAYMPTPQKRGFREVSGMAIDGAAVMPPATTVHMADALHTAPAAQLERA